jgi:hypothetical protein
LHHGIICLESSTVPGMQSDYRFNTRTGDFQTSFLVSEQDVVKPDRKNTLVIHTFLLLALSVEELD